MHVLPRFADEDCGELIRRKTLARLEDKDDSSDDVDEELEGVVEIASSNFETSTAHMEARHTALRAYHKDKATAAEKGKGWTADATPSDPTLAACLPSTGVGLRGSTCRPPDMLATCTSCIVPVSDSSNRYTWEMIPDRPTYGEIVEEQ
nr:hypothetical protein Iba_chr12bCG15820 [Ipomoea batatas]